MMDIPILSFLLIFPFIGVFVIFLLNKKDENYNKKVKEIGLWTTLINLFLSIILLYNFDLTESSFQFVETIPIIDDLGVYYYLGIDGISLPFILLTTFLIPICIISCWHKKYPNINYLIISFLLIELFLIGLFSSLDLFIFYIFFEGSFIPMFFIIGIWGSTNRIYAAYKFFLYTLFGSLLMLLGVLTIYFYSGTSNYTLISKVDFPFLLQLWLFLSFFASFAVKIPMWPFHTWLPDAHVEAPTEGSVILAAILLKLGGYGFLRFSLPLFPDAVEFFAPFIFILSITAIIYISLIALVQTNLKKLIAYSSVAHMGFVTLGIFSRNIEGLHGAMFQMISHGIISAALFFSVGALIERKNMKYINSYSGIWKKMPLFGSFFFIFVLGAIALPGTTGFIGEFLILIGSFKIKFYLSFLAGIGIILSAAYFLWLYGRLFFGNINSNVKSISNLNNYEIMIFSLLSFFVIFFGIYPDLLIKLYELSINKLIVI